MSVESIGLALKVSGVSTIQRMVLVGIANHDGDNGAWPGIARLAQYACVSERRVQQVIAELEALGLVTRHVNAAPWAKRSDRRANLYELHLDGVKPISPRGADGVKDLTPRGETQRADGVKPTSPEPSIEPSYQPATEPVDNSGPILDEVARRICKWREERSWGAAGPGAIGVARSEALAHEHLIRRWINEGHDEDEIIRCIVSRVVDGLPSSPRTAWAPPSYDDIADPERVREILAETGLQR